MLRSIAPALLAVGIAGCAAFGGGGDPPIDTVWRIAELDGVEVPRLQGNRAPTLLLDAEGRASGFTGCNRMTAGYTLEGDAIEFGTIASTRMACEPVASEVELAYLEALASVTAWRRRGDDLELRDAAGAVRIRGETTGRVDPVRER
jgi:heat shock protein HslJ